MTQQVSWSKQNNRGQHIRAIATALIERDDHLLLCQLARGEYAGFWLLPSASVDADTVLRTAQAMLPERTGYLATTLALVSVIEEPKVNALSLRFVFTAAVAEPPAPHDDTEIVQSRWFSKTAAREVLAERDVVPNLGVMSLIRAWADGVALRSLELLDENALCPCGTGYGFRGCCGWDAR
jgi:ADP-ribose pyrophosphatase YjhB (NUDIX family)